MAARCCGERWSAPRRRGAPLLRQTPAAPQQGPRLGRVARQAGGASGKRGRAAKRRCRLGGGGGRLLRWRPWLVGGELLVDSAAASDAGWRAGSRRRRRQEWKRRRRSGAFPWRWRRYCSIRLCGCGGSSRARGHHERLAVARAVDVMHISSGLRSELFVDTFRGTGRRATPPLSPLRTHSTQARRRCWEHHHSNELRTCSSTRRVEP